MSFFDDASLVMIPSGYKDQKVYSVKPTDGTGDLTFTRASSATRVQSNGLIEKVRTNANINFQGWAKLNGSEVLTSGVTDPFNGTNAFNLSGIVAGNYSYGLNVGTTLSVGASSYFTISLYAKGTGTIAITAQGTGFFTPLNITLTSTWTRYSLTIQPSGAISTFTFYISNYTGSTATSVDIAFPQAELGDIATDYIATTTAAVSVGPVSGLPRLDYLGSTCPKLLLEPQRTNTSPYSEQFTSGWASSGGSPVTANTTISPSGYQDADTIAETGNGNYLYQSVTTSSGTFTVSVFAKKGSSTNVGIGLVAGGFTSGMSVQFNFDTQTFATPTNHGSFTSISATSQNYGNGWYRLALTGTTATATTYFFVLGSLVGSAYAANVRLWGAQCEVGAYATSYIPTLGASVTRVADAASKTGITSLIGQTEGTLFVEFSVEELEPSGDYLMVSNLTDGTTSNRLGFARAPSGGIHVYVVAGGASQFTFDTTQTIGNFKLALAYKANDYKVYLNGVNVHTNTSASVPISMSRFDLNNLNGIFPSKNKVAQALLFKTRLTNAQLAELTA